MPQFTVERLNELKKNFNGKQIAVVGDLMLDSYYWGKVKRISPEAPVPVVEVAEEFSRFGGAANVAYNIVTLGAIAFPFGIIGNDPNAEILKNLMSQNNIVTEGLIVDTSRPTTTKTRIIAEKQQVVRIDKENRSDIKKDIEEEIFEMFSARIKSFDAVILQDYNKGVLTHSLIRKIIELCNKNEIIVTVDPKFDNFFDYQNATVFKPNRKETEDAFGIRIINDEDISSAGELLMKELKPHYALLTLGEDGIALFDNENLERRIPTIARKVADVSGAGDTVISTLTVAMAAGANILEASYLANYAGGLVCEEIGIVPINKEKLFKTILRELHDPQ
ncbi:MAG: D-glycero-beta-D-manno-heptose-7-phosphate kinase [Melioribacteraceae bacterium]|nr:D-glycero-beta-D-manno-heptose-7-phosphate kinase [Melioribacteraceae bacterium]MCO6474029.1 D-glycero-beta-D-manno-heptose-7-phosphate kinase [Melioribacteraceae bacterium]